MSIWGSLIGGFVGFSFAGPIGALIGSMVGGRISSARRSGFQRSFAPPQQVFAIALIILTAKLAKADGSVSKEELIAIKDKLKIPEHEIDQVGKIFNKAKEESAGYEPYAQQIAQIYKNNPNVLEEVINILFYIAEADGNISQSELNMMQHIAKIFGLNESQFNSIKESRKSSDKLNPYVVLGSKPEEDLSSIRKKYIQLSKENHPDLLVSKGVPIEVIEESKKKMRAINSAWDQIQKLKNKNCDAIILNDVSNSEIGIKSDDNEVYFITRDRSDKINKNSKQIVAEKIVKKITEEFF